LLGLNRQVYYRAKKSKCRRQQIALETIGLVKEIRQQMPRIGTRKLYYLLQEPLNKLGVGRDRLFSILRANHMLIKQKKIYHITTDSHHRFRKHKNLIENKAIVRPEQVWVSDITYIGTRKDPMYLALVTDAYSKKIVGFNVSNSLQTEGSLVALKMAIEKRRYKKSKLIHHSDRGLQYCSNEYQKLIKSNRLICSMTETYDPYANAVAERINGILKHEFINGNYYTDIQIMKSLITNSIEIYNEKRPHYSCFMKTPNEMHKQKKIKIRTYKTKTSNKNVFVGC
jgi:transposase InsO family protein